MPNFVRVECAPSQAVAADRKSYLEVLGYQVQIVEDAVRIIGTLESQTDLSDVQEEHCAWVVVGVLLN